ncbi:MAG TPA: protease HtpX, partial [bacterium]|nr:protease HtpX [bacterium]
MNNFLKTTFLLSALTLLLVMFGSAVGGENGMVTAF